MSTAQSKLNVPQHKWRITFVFFAYWVTASQSQLSYDTLLVCWPSITVLAVEMSVFGLFYYYNWSHVYFILWCVNKPFSTVGLRFLTKWIYRYTLQIKFTCSWLNCPLFDSENHCGSEALNTAVRKLVMSKGPGERLFELWISDHSDSKRGTTVSSSQLFVLVSVFC